jgi:hypothetical protein
MPDKRVIPFSFSQGPFSDMMMPENLVDEGTSGRDVFMT